MFILGVYNLKSTLKKRKHEKARYSDRASLEQEMAEDLNS